jgi:hypothetical protein
MAGTNKPLVSIVAKHKETGERKSIASVWPSDKGPYPYIKMHTEKTEYNADIRKVIANMDEFYFDVYINEPAAAPKKGRKASEEDSF